MNKVLFITTNDGTDMRIKKEVYTLASHNDITFLGISSTNSNFIDDVADCKFAKGEKSKLLTWVKYLFLVFKYLFFRKWNHIHVINEKPLIMFYVILLFKRNIILDLFDSMFLRKDLEGEKGLFYKKLCYKPVKKIIVTDENRYNLLPNIFQNKAVVIPNYPRKFKLIENENSTFKKVEGKINIVYYGWLGQNRGGKHVKDILNDERFHIHMAGWYADNESKSFIEANNVTYYGVLNQENAFQLVKKCGDFILCVYEPSNANQRNASPNKIYDALHLGVPLIINNEVKVSSFVKNQNLGILIKYGSSLKDIVNELNNYDNKDIDWEELKEKFCWEAIEKKLIALYN